MCNLLKRKLKDSVSRVDDLTIGIDYAGEATGSEAKESLDNAVAMHGRTLETAEKATKPERADEPRLFAANLQTSFYDFESDFFQQNPLRFVEVVVSVIKGSIELWPTLVKTCYSRKDHRGLPEIMVNNQRRYSIEPACCGRALTFTGAPTGSPTRPGIA